MLRDVLFPATLLWIIFVFVAMFEGLFRVQGYQRVLGPARAAWIGAVVLIAAILALTAAFLMNRRGEPFSATDLACIGLWWTALWLVLEFPFHCLVLTLPPRAWLARYRLVPPQPMLFVLLTLLLAPIALGALLLR
jgi:hypothetical protein